MIHTFFLSKNNGLNSKKAEFFFLNVYLRPKWLSSLLSSNVDINIVEIFDASYFKAHSLLLPTKNGNSCGSPIIREVQTADERFGNVLGGFFAGNTGMSKTPNSFVGYDGSFKSCTSNSFSMLFLIFSTLQFCVFSHQADRNFTCHFMAREGPDQLISTPINLIWVSLFLQSIIRQNGMQIQISHSSKVLLTLN